MTDHGNTQADSSVPFTHLPHTSPWPFMAAMGLLAGAFGVLPLLVGSPAAWILIIPGAGIFFIALAGWLGQMAREDISEVKNLTRPEFPDISLWFVLFLVLSELALFGCFFATYFYLHNWDIIKSGSQNHFFQIDGKPMEVWGLIPLLNTIFLVTSSVTLQIGEGFLKKGREDIFRVWLGFTIILGLLFIGGQVTEYVHFITVDKFTVASGPLGSTFYSLTGLHGLHVTAGALLLILLFAGSFFRIYSPKRHNAVTVIGIYWHFVDVIWLFLVAVLYLRLI